VFESKWPVAWPLLALVIASALIRATDFDLWLAALFYDPVAKRWPYEVAQPWMSIYRYGMIPSLGLGICGAIVALFGKSILPRIGWRDSRFTRRAGLFLISLLVLGPGLIINVGFKEMWGRPRPLQCVAFGGEKQFLPLGTWADTHLSNSSFPSGHAAVAFYLMAPSFIAGQGRRRLKIASFAAGTLYGLGMGLTRVVQGGHFASDILWAGAIVYLTGVALARLILRNDEPMIRRTNSGTPCRRR
jgi:membrane-associated PAP2 superfamily phosphatase